jgi:hypothetical protein
VQDAGCTALLQHLAFLREVDYVVTEVIFRERVVGFGFSWLYFDPFAFVRVFASHHLKVQVWVASHRCQHHKLVLIGAGLEEVVVSTSSRYFAELSDATE